MTQTLRIRDWAKHYENNRTRDLRRMSWVPMPNRHDGDGYTELVLHKDGPAHFGVWCALVQVASKCEPRGTLLRDGGAPHNSESIERITRIPQRVIEEAIKRLLKIRWLESLPPENNEVAGWCGETAGSPHEGAGKPQEGDIPRVRAHACAERNGTERTERTEGKEQKDLPALPPELDTDRFRSALSEWMTYRKQKRMKAYTPIGVEKQLKRLAKEFGHDGAIDAIEFSIAQGWDGIHGRSNGGSNRGDSRAQRGDADRRREDKGAREYSETSAEIRLIDTSKPPVRSFSRSDSGKAKADGGGRSSPNAVGIITRSSAALGGDDHGAG